ncbi:S-adenosyl-L-methionine-dependent methyltransferase [Syncephalis plumigaleata]|nr:S-adenosyl-L-methionine-dependent methyltransferase [Syncephalis plumigaleata]
MFIGDKKGAIIDDAIRENTPRIAIELGTYCGYSAIRFANLMRKLACDVKYYTFESNPAFARIASQLIEFAGLSDIVKIIEGTFNDKLPGFLNKHPEVKQADFVLIDHIKNRYVPDLKLLEQKRLLARDTLIIADNIKFPGAPEYRDYVLNCSKYYTILYNVSLEYNETIRDVIAISIYQ